MNQEMKYKIVYRDGEFLLNLHSESQNHIANISDGEKSVHVTLLGKDPDDLYANCRSWASTNIRGEFAIERLEQ
jgi:hypothetical protein